MIIAETFIGAPCKSGTEEPFRFIDFKEIKNSIIDGIAFFKYDKMSLDDSKLIRFKLLRTLIDLDPLWHQSIAVEFNQIIHLMNSIFECLCLNDLEYKNQFEKVKKFNLFTNY